MTNEIKLPEISTNKLFTSDVRVTLYSRGRPYLVVITT